MADNSTPSRILHRLVPLLGIALFAAALWVLHHELKQYHYHQVVHELRNLPGHHVLYAILLMVLSYWILTFYDYLALHYISYALSYPKTALASFLGYVFSHNLGLSALGASAARYRIYSVYGMSAIDVGSIVVFCGLTFWIGFCVVAGSIFLLAPISLPVELHLPFTTLRPIGVICLTFVAAYALGAAFWRKPLRIHKWEFQWPTVPVVSGQILVSSLDWIVAACVFYTLLPSAPGLTFWTVLATFMVSQLAGILSHVPGGVGVFETVVVLMLSPIVSAPVVLAALVAFRLIYYVLPLTAGILALLVFEGFHRRHHLMGIWNAIAPWLPVVVPNVFAIAMLVSGVVLLFSGATPAARHRLPRLAHVVPLPVIELSHFVGSVVGISLILVARGLQRRLDGAYIMAMLFLATGAVVSILKGLDYEEATLLIILFIALSPFHRYFYRKSSVLSERFTPGWIVTIGIIVAASVWLGLFSYKHVEYSDELWWKFSLAGHAPRFLRATAGVVVTLVLFSMAKLMKPAAPEPQTTTRSVWEDVSRVVAACPYTYAHLAFLGDKQFLFNDTRDGFIMYATEGRSWVAMGDPVAPEGSQMELIWQFRELCDRHDAWSVFYEVNGRNLCLYLDAGLTLQKIGEEARVPLEGFSLEGHRWKALRHSHHGAVKESCTFRVLEPFACRERLPEIRQVSDEWLEHKKTREKGFSLGFFDEDYLARTPLAIVEQGGRLIAFANLWLGANHEELSLDLMRYATQAPRSVMDYLFIELMLWGRQQQYRWFNLGMAPLAGLQNRPLAPTWNRFGSLLFRHGEHFYNFQGLRNYKNKFDPIWEPKYLAIPAGSLIPRILVNIGALTAGGLKGVLAK